MHNACVLWRSVIFRKAERGEILSAPTVHINRNELGPYIVGDSAYPLSPWLMKPYPHGTRDRDEIKFNKQLSSARVKVECSFGLRVDGEYCRNVSIVALNLQLKIQ